MTTPGVTITRNTAGPTLDSLAIEGMVAFVGTSDSGDLDTPTALRTKTAPRSSFGEGMMPEAARIAIDYTKQLHIGVRAEATVDASYAAINVSAFTGTAEAVVSTATLPKLDGEIYIKFITGGTLGVTGITYQESVDRGDTMSPTKALGTATRITVEPVGAVIELAPDGLRALVDECVDDYLAHIADAVSHDPADTTNTVSTAPVITMAEIYAKASAIKTAAGAHVANTGGTYHDVADTVVAGAAITALVVPTTPATAITFWNSFKAIFNTHRTQATIHPTNDTTNVVTATDSAAGTVVADDIIQDKTTGPKWDVDTLATALDSLTSYEAYTAGAVAVIGAITSDAEFDALSTFLDNMREEYKPTAMICHTRLPNAGETEAQYLTAMATLTANWEDNRITVLSGGIHYVPSEIASEEYKYLRSPIAPYAARHAATDPGVSVAFVKEQRAEKAGPAQIGGPLKGAAIIDADGLQVGHDERLDPGLDDLGLTVMRTHPMRDGKCYVNIPRTMAPDGDKLYHASSLRLVNMVERVVYFELSDLLQLAAIVDPVTYFIAPASANQIEGIVRAAIRKDLGARLSNIDEDEIFALSRSDNLNVTPPATPTVNGSGIVKTPQFIGQFDVQLSVNP